MGVTNVAFLVALSGFPLSSFLSTDNDVTFQSIIELENGMVGLTAVLFVFCIKLKALK